MFSYAQNRKMNLAFVIMFWMLAFDLGVDILFYRSSKSLLRDLVLPLKKSTVL